LSKGPEDSRQMYYGFPGIEVARRRNLIVGVSKRRKEKIETEPDYTNRQKKTIKKKNHGGGAL